MKHLIVGDGRSALRAAARLDNALWLSTGAEPDSAAEIPEDRGHVSAEDGADQRVAALYGAAPSTLAPTRGILLGGKVRALPLRRRDLFGLLPPDAARRALEDWVRTRARIHLRKLVGGGLEERSYRDWVVHRVGEGAFEHIYRRYGEARFGPTEAVNAAAARQAHAQVQSGPRVALGSSPAAGLASLRRKVADARVGPRVTGVTLRDGKVAGVRTNEGEIELEGQLWWASSLTELVLVMGEVLSEGTRWEMRGLPCRHRVQVMLRRSGAGAELPGELHVLDSAPFFRVSRPALIPGCESLEQSLVAHLSLPDDSPLWRGTDRELVEQTAAAFSALGLPAVESAGAVVLRLPNYDPCWQGVWHPWHVRTTHALAQLGVRLVGRGATYRRMDAGRELLLLDAMLRSSKDDHELFRVLVDPPVVLDDEQASFSRFVEQ